MAVGVRYYTPNQFEIDQNGVPLAAGQLFFFESGTSTPQDTYQDQGLTTANKNPIIADANGRFGSIFLSPANQYKVQLFTAATALNPTGSEIWSEDPVGPPSQSSTAGIIGEVRAFAGPAADVPAQWYLCDGVAVSRSAFSALFAILGTAWGSGDGSTTFNLPDLRGRTLFGLDNMGGTPANRVTSAVSGINGTTLGAVGGDQNVQTHNHTLTDPGHTHAVTDPQHHHAIGKHLAGTGGGTVCNAIGTDTFDLVTQAASTGITINSGTTGITLATFGSGASQNMPPAGMLNWIIFASA